jgi:hypothetical protein
MPLLPGRMVADSCRRPFLSFLNISCFLILGFSCLSSTAEAQSLTVINTDGHAAVISTAQIASAPHVSMNVVDHGQPAKFEGVPLSAILTMAGIQLGDSLHGARLTEILLVSASDGYKVAFALAETDPAFAPREIILADKRDDKPLDSKEGPFRIVAPGDKRPARWIRQVTEMKVAAVR